MLLLSHFERKIWHIFLSLNDAESKIKVEVMLEKLIMYNLFTVIDQFIEQSLMHVDVG